VKDDDGQTLWHIAVIWGHVEIARYLLEMEGIEVEAANLYGQTALHLASTNGHLESVKLLVEVYSANMNATDNDGLH
jgi:ankyrin repeat protein